MNLFQQYLKTPLFAPEDEAGGAPAGETSPAGDMPAEGQAAPEAAAAPESEAPASKWWEGDRFSDDQRKTLVASGLTVDDPLEAVAKLTDFERAAQKKLGGKPDQLMQKPKEGQNIAEFRNEHRELFGVPENAEGYQIDVPEGFGDDGLKWDSEFEGQVRQLAVERGLSNEDVQSLTGLYADKIKSMSEEAGDQLERANEQMMGTLTKEWGDQTSAKIAMAKVGAEHLASQAGLDTEALAGIAELLTTKGGGDANTLKLFSVIGELLGEDQVGRVSTHGGSLTTTPAEARAELQRLQSPGGEQFEAVASKDRATLARLKPKIDQLSKIVAG